MNKASWKVIKSNILIRRFTRMIYFQLFGGFDFRWMKDDQNVSIFSGSDEENQLLLQIIDHKHRIKSSDKIKTFQIERFSLYSRCWSYNCGSILILSLAHFQEKISFCNGMKANQYRSRIFSKNMFIKLK